MIHYNAISVIFFGEASHIILTALITYYSAYMCSNIGQWSNFLGSKNLKRPETIEIHTF